jgi:hypothetical protein
VGRVRDKKFRVQASAGKVMVSVFWYSKDAVLRKKTNCNATCVQSSDASAEEIFTRPAKIVSCKGGKIVWITKDTLWKNNLNFVNDAPLNT